MAQGRQWHSGMRLAFQLALILCALTFVHHYAPGREFGSTDPTTLWQQADGGSWSTWPQPGGWHRQTLPSPRLDEDTRLYLSTPFGSQANLWLLQHGHPVVRLDAGATAPIRTSLLPQLDGSPVTLLMAGPFDARFGLGTPAFDSSLMLALCLALSGSALLMSALQPNRRVAVRVLVGPLLLSLPLLDIRLVWLVLALPLLLYLPRAFRGWRLPLLGTIGVVTLLPLSWLVGFPLLLLPLQLTLLVIHSHRGNLLQAGQLLLLLFFSLERLPSPHLPPDLMMALALAWPILLQLELARRLRPREAPQALAREGAPTGRRDVLKSRLQSLEWENRLLREKSTTDPLTGLRNRQFFNEQYRAEVGRSARDGTAISLLLMDLDHFKKVNDTHGHPVGDHVLQEVAKRAYYALRRPADSLCRIGGEEFAILLPNTTDNGARHVAETLVKQIARTPIRCGDQALGVTASIGVATLTQQPDMMEMELLRRADAALYRAKALGRNRVECALSPSDITPSPQSVPAGE